MCPLHLGYVMDKAVLRVYTSWLPSEPRAVGQTAGPPRSRKHQLVYITRGTGARSTRRGPRLLKVLISTIDISTNISLLHLARNAADHDAVNLSPQANHARKRSFVLSAGQLGSSHDNSLR
jgi:hypothetical protein